MTSLECSICLAFYHRDFSQGKRTGLIGCPQCKCPLCRQQIDTREGGLEPLPNHITASDHITARYEVGVEDLRNHCGCCWKDGAADFHCNDCEDFLCLSCKDQHLRTKQTRNHVITVVDDFDRTWEKTTDQFVNCRFHDPFLLEYFCVRCGTVCCAMGRHNKHESHNVQLLPEAAEEKRNMVKSYIEMAKEHYTTVANEIYDILINQDNLKTFIDRETVTIDNVADQFKGSIDRARRELKTRIIRTLETLDEKFKESLESYNDKFKMILALIQSTDQILNEASNQDVLSFQGDLINHLIKEEAKFKVKDPHSTYLATSEVEDALIKNIHVQDPTNVSSLLQPLLLNKVRRPFKVEGREITAIACLNNGVILVCQGNTKRLTVVGARGEDFWCFVIRFR